MSATYTPEQIEATLAEARKIMGDYACMNPNRRALVEIIEQLRAEADHYKRCNDPENCVDDPVTMDGARWKGCTENIRLAMERAKKEKSL